jgi:hypothetical protein
VQLPAGAVDSPFGRAAGEILPPLNALLGREPARRGGSDIEGLRPAGAPVLSQSQNGWDCFDTHHTAGDTFDNQSGEIGAKCGCLGGDHLSGSRNRRRLSGDRQIRCPIIARELSIMALNK